MTDRAEDDRDERKTRHIDAPLGDRLRLERDANNMTRRALAERLDVSESTVQQWEEGRTRVPAARLWQVCRLLDVEVSDVFESLPHHVEPSNGAGVRQTGSTYVQNDGRSRKVVALTRAAAKLPQDRLDIAVDLIKALKPKP